MRISCLPVSFFDDILKGAMTIKEWASLGREAGLDAIDLNIILFKDQPLDRVKALRGEIEEEGMTVEMVTTYSDFCHPDPLQCQREMEYAERDISLTALMGGKYLRILAGQAHPGVSYRERKQDIIESLKKAASMAETRGVQLLFENHSKPGAWKYPDISHPTEIFLDIAEAIKDTGIGINFDTANTLAYGDDPIPVLMEVLDRVETVHAADTRVTGALEPVLLGEGLVPFPRIFSILKKNGFDGLISIEEASKTGKDAVKKARDFVYKTWGDV